MPRGFVILRMVDRLKLKIGEVMELMLEGTGHKNKIKSSTNLMAGPT